MISSAFDIPRLAPAMASGTSTDWSQAFRIGHLIPVLQPLPAPGLFAASAWLGWHDEGLLVRVEVIGAGENESETMEQLWNGDSVELYLAPSPVSLDRCQWVIGPGVGERFPAPRSFVHDHRQSEALKQLPVNIAFTSRRTASGYSVEALLPWRSLGIVPKSGLEVACQIMVNRRTINRGLEHLLWFPMLGAFADSRKMHRLRLSRTSAPASVARAIGWNDFRTATSFFEVFADATLAGQAVRVRTAEAVLAEGRLQADGSGYARLTLEGLLTERAFLEVQDRCVDVIPLGLPAASPARAWTIDVRMHRPAILTLPAGVGACTVRSRRPGDAWVTVAEGLAPGEIHLPDLADGALREYAVLRGEPDPASEYVYAGHEVPLVDRRGTVVLVVEQSQAGLLAAEIRRLVLDLVGDGWQVIRHVVSARQSPVEVKHLIAAQPADAVLLLGHVPVPYAGDFAPDHHHDHVGAWPADVYYGALDGVWREASATSAREPAGQRQRNLPGDGTFESSEIPGPVRLAVGRVDFHDLPAFGADETALLREYLDRNHAYRQGTMPVESRGWVQDNFAGHPERFGYSGWQNLTTLLGPEDVVVREWPNIEPVRHLWFYGCGGGGWQSMAGFGGTVDLASTPLNAVFAMLFGSYFGDWDSVNNLQRAALAGNGGALTCGWAGRPHWYLHPMGMGATIGECLLLTQNNTADGYRPAGSYARGVHIALLGDPTLRMHRVMPPLELRVTGQSLQWRRSPQPGVRYHVYRAAAEIGPYERLTSETIADCAFTDSEGRPDAFYMVRAVALQRTLTGSYYNASQGVFPGPSRKATR